MPAFLFSFIIYVISCRLFSSEQAAFLFLKNFSFFFANRLPKRPLPVGISEGVTSPPRRKPLHCSLKIEYQIFKYVTCIDELRWWVRHDLGLSERAINLRHKCRTATDTAMTYTTIMILLYGAAGEPGRGESPMKPLRWRLLEDFP